MYGRCIRSIKRKRINMKKITKDAINAFYNRQNFKKSNTQVISEEFSTHLLLFDNLIATKLIDLDELIISTANHNSRTIRERLNSLKGVHVYISKGQLVLNEKAWDGKLITIN